MIEESKPDEYLLLMESRVYLANIYNPCESPVTKLLQKGILTVSQLPSSQDCITIIFGRKDNEKVGHIIFKTRDGASVFEPIQWYKKGSTAGRFAGLRNSHMKA